MIRMALKYGSTYVLHVMLTLVFEESGSANAQTEASSES
jgi:hypothetical protein